jgi:hypothetical protein
MSLYHKYLSLLLKRQNIALAEKAKPRVEVCQLDEFMNLNGKAMRKGAIEICFMGKETRLDKQIFIIVSTQQIV